MNTQQAYSHHGRHMLLDNYNITYQEINSVPILLYHCLKEFMHL